jgi:GAF domain-containing protein
MTRARTWKPGRENVVSRALLERAIVHIADVNSEPGYAAPEAVTVGKVRTALGVPLLREGEPIGVILLARQRVEPFSERQIELVRTFADQAVIAIENTRLITETREALEQQTATAEVLQVINSSPGDLTPVFDAMLDRATRLCDAALGVLSGVDDGQRVSHVAFSGPSEITEFLKSRLPVQPGPGTTMARLVDGENFVEVLDATTEDVFRRGDPGRRAMVDFAKARTIAGIALRKDGALLGTITLYRQEVRACSDKEIGLLQNFAAQAVIAMENARLITETREALERQTATAEVLQVINSSPGDLAPVFDATLDKALRVCEAAFGALSTRPVAAGDPTHALFGHQSHCIPDNLVALFGTG